MASLHTLRRHMSAAALPFHPLIMKRVIDPSGGEGHSGQGQRSGSMPGQMLLRSGLRTIQAGVYLSDSLLKARRTITRGRESRCCSEGKQQPPAPLYLSPDESQSVSLLRGKVFQQQFCSLVLPARMQRLPCDACQQSKQASLLRFISDTWTLCSALLSQTCVAVAAK